MLEALPVAITGAFGGVVGGLFRLAPEVLKLWDRKNERQHELAMLDKNLEADRLKAASAQQLAQTQADATISAAEIAAMIEAIKTQGQLTGIKFVDGMNSLVRPLLAFQWLLILWPAVVIAGIVLGAEGGTGYLSAIKASWGMDEKAMASAIAGFWLVDRSIRKA